jgi:hypothetical protein
LEEEEEKQYSSSSDSDGDEERDDRELLQSLKHMIRLGVEQSALKLLDGEPHLQHISQEIKLKSIQRD